jgi:hydrogenase nickel incorporation protein HypB
MCATCGCGAESAVRLSNPAEAGDAAPDHGHAAPDHGHAAPDHGHAAPDHGHAAPDHRHAAPDHGHVLGERADRPAYDHPHNHAPDLDRRLQAVEINILAKNDQLAAANRRRLAERGITALNLMSSPGSGKTTLLVRTVTDLITARPVAVIEGDQETQLDAERIHATGVPVIQVNTGAGCHLDAAMMRDALTALPLQQGALLFVENVGNLVCPAMFDLGESARVVVVSVTEGQDKPLKYPQMFAAADLVVINKSDLLPYVDFDVAACTDHVRRVNPAAEVIVLSATTGSGLVDWYRWLTSRNPQPVSPDAIDRSVAPRVER